MKSLRARDEEDAKAALRAVKNRIGDLHQNKPLRSKGKFWNKTSLSNVPAMFSPVAFLSLVAH
jgi:hypothetical protein